MHRAVNADFFKTWSPEMAYILGFFAADGYLTLNKRGAHFWNIQITDEHILIEIKKAIRSEHKISVRSRKGNEKIIYRLQIGNKEMCTDLEKLGFMPNKTKSLAVPHVPQKYFSHFVRGYFDGDGNVWFGLTKKERKSPSLTLLTAFTSCSRRFLVLLLKKLRQQGIDGGSIYDSKNNYSRLQLGTRDSLKLYKLMYNREDSSELLLVRKKVVFERFLATKKNAVVA